MASREPEFQPEASEKLATLPQESRLEGPLALRKDELEFLQTENELKPPALKAETVLMSPLESPQSPARSLSQEQRVLQRMLADSLRRMTVRATERTISLSLLKAVQVSELA